MFQLRKIGILFILLCTVRYSIFSQCEILGKRNVCVGSLNSFSLNTTGAVVSYSWDFGNGNTSTQTQPGAVYNSTGKYIVSCTVVYSGGATCTDTFSLEAYSNPKANLILNKKVNYCYFNQSVFLLDSSKPAKTGQTIASTLIVWGDGNFSKDSTWNGNDTFFHNYTDTGKYLINYEVTDIVGCKDVGQISSVRILADVKAYLDLTRQYYYCDSSTIQVQNKTDTGFWGGAFYEFTFNKKRKVSANQFVEFWNHTSYNINDSIEIKLDVTSKHGCKSTYIKNVKILADSFHAKAAITDTVFCFSQKTGILLLANQVEGAEYLWHLDDGGTITTTDSAYNFIPSKYLQKLGYTYVTLEIKRGQCSKFSKKLKIYAKGFIPRIISFYTEQCTPDSQVYVLDSTRFSNPSKVYRIWNFGDAVSTQCTSWRKQNIQPSPNCNFSRDIWEKHKYSSVGLYTIKLYQYDTVSGCESETPIDVTIQVCRAIKKPISICVGSKFLEQISGTISPIKFKFPKDTAWRKYGSFLTNDDTGIHGLYLIYPVYHPVLAGQKKDSLFGYRNPKKYDTLYYDSFVKVISASQLVFKLEKFSDCNECTWKLKFKDGRLSIPGELAVYLNTLSNVKLIYNKTIDNNNGFDSLIIKTLKNTSNSIKVNFWSSSGCVSEYNFDLFCGVMIFPNFEGAKCIGQNFCYKPNANVYGKYVDYWSDNNPEGTLHWKINGADSGSGFKKCFFPKKAELFLMEITATDKFGCTAKLIDSVDVGKITAHIKKFPEPLICNEIAQFFDSSISLSTKDTIKRFYWSFGDTTRVATISNPYHFFGSGGTFQIKHWVETKYKCRDTVSKTIQILGPTVHFDIITDTVGCSPLKITFKNNSKKCSQFLWLFKDSANNTFTTGKDSNVNFTYIKPGRYYPQLYGSDTFYSPYTGKNYVCSAIFPDPILHRDSNRSIWVWPTIKLKIWGADSLCTNDSATFYTNSNLYLDSFVWNFDNTKTIQNTAAKLSVGQRYSAAGKYFIELNGILNPQYKPACIVGDKKEIVILDIAADFEIDDKKSPKILFNNKSNANAINFYWDFGDPNSGSNNYSAQKNPEHVYPSEEGTYTVCLVAENELGCLDTVCKEISIKLDSNYLRIANVFTPVNPDQLNDDFDIIIFGETFYHLKIFNRWGEKVFEQIKDEAQNSGKNWNGKVMNTGAECPEGAYFYDFTYSFSPKGKNKKNVKGPLYLIRKN